jgi:hypothetical protein
MAIFTQTTTDLERVGPVANIFLSIASGAEEAFKRAGQNIPSALSVQAMIDTGAEVSVIKKGLADKLGIHPVGTNQVATPSSSVRCPVYAVRFIFPSSGYLDVTLSRLQCKMRVSKP